MPVSPSASRVVRPVPPGECKSQIGGNICVDFRKLWRDLLEKITKLKRLLCDHLIDGTNIQNINGYIRLLESIHHHNRKTLLTRHRRLFLNKEVSAQNYGTLESWQRVFFLFFTTVSSLAIKLWGNIFLNLIHNWLRRNLLRQKLQTTRQFISTRYKRQHKSHF